MLKQALALLLFSLAAGCASSSTPPAQTKPHACTPGQDQSCNDPPWVSAIWGKCLSDGTCQCASGFVIHPSTGRCTAPDAGL